nr:hypothetical protein [Tanacetum cinerariifolium]
MRQRCWIELFSDYDCEICYHPGKANVTADALTRKERVKPKRVRAMNMTLQSSIKDRILAAQKEAFEESIGLQRGIDKMIELRRADKMYYDLRDRYWWPGMKKDIVLYSVHIEVWQSMQEALGTRLDMSAAYHPQTDGQKFSYNNSYHSSVRCVPFEALYGKKCRFPIMRAEKSYADKKRKPLELSVGDYVLLKVSPWKDVARFGKKGKLAPRFVGPFEIIEKVGPVAYRLDLPKELNGVHNTFHVSNLKKCLADPTLQRESLKKLKRSRIAIFKVRWHSKRGPGFMWECED